MTFLVGFTISYLLISFPAMLGTGDVIDWVPEATWLKKLKGYVIGGLTDRYFAKTTVTITQDLPQTGACP